MSDLVVTELFIYPIKGCRGESVESMTLAPEGPEFDRRYMVVDRKGRFLSQRTHPRLARILTHRTTLGMGFSADGDVGPEYRPTGTQVLRGVTVHADTFHAADCGDEVGAWFSNYLGEKDLRLVKCDPVFPRLRRVRDISQGDGEEMEMSVSMADGYPILLAQDSSRESLQNAGDTFVAMRRFRPNIVVGGGEPFDEDYWQDMEFTGSEHPPTRIRGMKRCDRCVVTTVNQYTGETDGGANPLKLLASMGRVLPVYPSDPRAKKGAVFGQNCILLPSAEVSRIQIGDKVRVLSRYASVGR